MPVQLIRRVRDRQPLRQSKIDYSNPICSGLVFCVNRADNVDLVSGKNPTYTTTSRTPVPGIYGYAETSTGFLNYGRTKADDIAGPGTIFAISRLISATNGYIISSGENANGRGFSYWSDNISYINNGFVVGLGVNVQRTTDSGANVIASTLAPEPSCVTWDGANIKFFASKKLVRTVANTTVPTADASRVTRLAERGSISSTVINSATGLVCVWNRALSEQEVVHLLKSPWQLFDAETVPLFWSGVTAQFLRPISDVSNSGWTPSSGSDLFPMIGETTRNDATYISAVEAGAWCEVLLGTSTGDPLSSISHLPRIVMSAGAGGIIIRLKQGATLIKEWTYSSLTGTDTLYEPTLTGGEIDSITDYTDLRLYLETTL